MAAADPDLSSNHSSEEDSHSSGDEETASHKEPRVHHGAVLLATMSPAISQLGLTRFWPQGCPYGTLAPEVGWPMV